MIILRDYQNEIVKNTRQAMSENFKRILIVSPTGSGKTVIFSYLAEQAVKKNKRVMIIAHRDELLDQIAETLEKFNVEISFISPGRFYNSDSKTQVASAFTVVRRLKKVYEPDLIIVDEAAHACQGSTWGKIIDAFDTHTIGVTATPCRLSGEPLGEVFEKMIMGPTVKHLISIGALSKYKYYAPENVDLSRVKTRAGDYAVSQLNELLDTPHIVGSAINEYIKFLNNKRAVIFCCSISHAKSVAYQFSEIGIPALCIDSNMKKDERRKAIAEFRANRVKVLTNVNIITEGFDLKELEGVIMLRPTQSLSLYLQMVGRGLRPAEGKEHAIILDHVGNYERHGFPCDDREWSLDSKISKRKKTDAPIPIHVCPICYMTLSLAVSVCECGHTFEAISREDIKIVEGKLIELSPEEVSRNRKLEQGNAKSFDELVTLGEKRGYAQAKKWAALVVKARKKRQWGTNG